MADNKYNVLYNLAYFNLAVGTAGFDNTDYNSINKAITNINIPKSDILSIAVINNYDTAMYPIIRIRLYTDLSNMISISEHPDEIYVNIGLHGIICDTTSTNDGNASIKQLKTTNGDLYGNYKAYLENKNIPTSFADEYEQGLKKSDDLNVDRKVPITLFCYDAEMVRFMRQKVNSIFKDMDITSVIETIFRKQGDVDIKIDPIYNQTKYDQILFPNLSVLDSLSFIEAKYGLYPKGAQIYGEDGDIKITDSDVNNGTTPIPIHVQSYKDSDNGGGMRRIDYDNNIFHNNTRAENVSVTTISDIERILNSEQIAAVNVNTLSIETSKLSELYDNIDKELSFRVSGDEKEKWYSLLRKKITTPDLLHKSKNPYLADMYNARISERITRIDISGSGIDALSMNVKSRYNVIFDTPIRGLSINQFYRASTLIHVFSNMGNGEWFTSQTTMRLCSN